MRKAPERFWRFVENYPGIATAYENLAGECHRLGPLNARERALVQLGIAAGSNMEGSVRSQVRKALDLGMQPNEICHAIILSLTAIGYPRMMAALTWAEDVLNKDLETH
jgi:alkylhydroperoxidase/carboxymuconolactone decarboxylase family protein YurZ